MPTYISFCRWTEQGAADIKGSPARLDAGKKAFEKDGVKMLHFFMTMGKYDMIFISEAPSDEAVAKALLSLIGKGSISTQTTRAFTEAEYRKITGGL